MEVRNYIRERDSPKKCPDCAKLLPVFRDAPTLFLQMGYEYIFGTHQYRYSADTEMSIVNLFGQSGLVLLQKVLCTALIKICFCFHFSKIPYCHELTWNGSFFQSDNLTKTTSTIVFPLIKNDHSLNYKDDKNPQVQALTQTHLYPIKYWHLLGKNLCNACHGSRYDST